MQLTAIFITIAIMLGFIDNPNDVNNLTLDQQTQIEQIVISEYDEM